MTKARPRRRRQKQRTPLRRWLRRLCLALRPTDHLPASEGKVRVMRLRAAFELPLFDPDDAE